MCDVKIRSRLDQEHFLTYFGLTTFVVLQKYLTVSDLQQADIHELFLFLITATLWTSDNMNCFLLTVFNSFVIQMNVYKMIPDL